jgi:hypothetical protein
MAKYNGFTSYVTTGTFTPEFIHDYKYWCWKIFKRWTLFTDFDNFYSICWEALLTKIPEFDPKISQIQTFCISRINNEAWRLYMKNQASGREIDADDPVIQGELIARSETELFETFSDFERYANSLGVEVNLKELYAMYSEYDKDSKVEPAPLIAFAAWRAMRHDIGGRDDIQKRKRRVAAKSSN